MPSPSESWNEGEKEKEEEERERLLEVTKQRVREQEARSTFKC